MSMHKIPLTQLEEEGLRAHGLDIGKPSQLSDVFRQGVAWSQKAEREPLSEWQPIETAPYDVRVLAWIYLPKNPIASGQAIAERCFLENDEPESYGEHRRTVGCWWANGRYYHAGSETGYVTHWMPLPKPPN